MKKLIYAFGLMLAMGIYANNTLIAQDIDEYYCPMHEFEEPEGAVDADYEVVDDEDDKK